MCALSGGRDHGVTRDVGGHTVCSLGGCNGRWAAAHSLAGARRLQQMYEPSFLHLRHRAKQSKRSNDDLSSPGTREGARSVAKATCVQHSRDVTDRSAPRLGLGGSIFAPTSKLNRELPAGAAGGENTHADHHVAGERRGGRVLEAWRGAPAWCFRARRFESAVRGRSRGGGGGHAHFGHHGRTCHGTSPRGPMGGALNTRRGHAPSSSSSAPVGVG